MRTWTYMLQQSSIKDAQHQPANINLIMRTALMAALCATSAGKHL